MDKPAGTPLDDSTIPGHQHEVHDGEKVAGKPIAGADAGAHPHGPVHTGETPIQLPDGHELPHQPSA